VGSEIGLNGDSSIKVLYSVMWLLLIHHGSPQKKKKKIVMGIID